MGCFHPGDLIRCKAGIPKYGKFTPPNLPDTECSGPNFEDLCYVMYTDYHGVLNKYDAWTYGCIIKGSLNKCNKSYKRSMVTNNYCCCDTPDCNDTDFARRCDKR